MRDISNPLVYAAKEGHREIINDLIRNGVDLNQEDPALGLTPILAAIVYKQTNTIKQLIEAKCEINSTNNSLNMSPFMKAVQMDELTSEAKILEILSPFKGIADIHQKNPDGNTALHFACNKQNASPLVIRYLIEEFGFDWNVENNKKWKPIIYAILQGNKGILEYYYGEDPDERTRKKEELMNWVDANGRSIIHLLATVKLQDNENNELSNDDMISEFWSDDLIKKKDNQGLTPIAIAAQEYRLKAMESLLKKITSNKDRETIIQEPDNYGRSPLYFAACGNNKELVQLLIDRKADIAHTNRYGETPFFVACMNGNKDIVNCFLNNEDKSICSIAKKDGTTPLMIAAWNGRSQIINTFISLHNNSSLECLNINQKDKFGRTALIIAAQNNRNACVKELIKSDEIQVNIKDGNGLTALYYAAKNNNDQIVKDLLEQGADPNIVGEDHKKPEDVTNSPEIKKIIQNHVENNEN